jgi:Ca2+-binding EF-hand superfamily protein
MPSISYIKTALLAFAVVATPAMAGQNQSGSAAQAQQGGVQAQTGSGALGRQGAVGAQTGSQAQARQQPAPRRPAQPQANDQPSPGAALPPSTNPGAQTPGNAGRAATPAPQTPGVNAPRSNQPGATSPNVPRVTAPTESQKMQNPAAAQAQAGSPPFFSGADVNQDGSLSADEMRTFLPFFNDDQFTQFDLNGDGVLSPAEAAGPIATPNNPQVSTDTFLRGDANADQRLTPDELRRIAPQFSRENFQQFDADNDGFINSDEWSVLSRGSVAAGLQDIPLMNADTDGDGQVSVDELNTLMPNISNEEFRRVDTNRDNFLSRTELTASSAANLTVVQGSAESFNRVDTNNDGSVTFSELAATAPQFRQDQFTELDINRDGILGIDEWSSAVPGAAPNSALTDGRLARADRNNNGRFSFRELSRVASGVTRAEFNAADANRDGDLTAEELQAAGFGQRIEQ